MRYSVVLLLQYLLHRPSLRHIHPLPLPIVPVLGHIQPAEARAVLGHVRLAVLARAHDVPVGLQRAVGQPARAGHVPQPLLVHQQALHERHGHGGVRVEIAALGLLDFL